MNFWLIIFWISVGLLAYVMLLYPAICCLAGLWPRREAGNSMPDNMPSVSLIIPAFNEETVLRRKLENTLAIDYPSDRLEILVASDGSSDDTNNIARQFADRGVRLLDFSRRRGKASVVNDGLAAATGEIVCLCDANVMFQPKALKLLVARLTDPAVGAVTGEVRLASEESPFGTGESFYYRIERALQAGESRLGSLMGVDGGLYLLRKSLFRPLPADTLLDDFVTSMNVLRQGHRVVYEPRAIAAENGTPLTRQEFRRRVRVTAGAVQSVARGAWPALFRPVECWQYLSHKLLRWLTPVWFALALASSAVLAVSDDGFRAVLAIELLACLAATLAAVWPPARRLSPLNVLFYLSLSQLAMLVGLVKGLLGHQGGAWTPTARTASATHVA